MVDSVLLTPLPYPEPERLVAVHSRLPGREGDDFWLSPPEFLELRREAGSFEALAAWVPRAINVVGLSEPVRAEGVYVTPGLFSALGVEPVLGRLFSDAAARPGVEPVAVLSHGLWRHAFGSDRRIVGRRVRVDGSPVTVVAVLPPGFEVGGRRFDVWLPLALDPASPMREAHFLNVLGRLREGYSLGPARAELEGILARWPETHPGLHTPDTREHRIVFEPLLDSQVGEARPALRLLLGAVAFVLLIAAANVASLLLARAEGRRREIAVRTALGAGRGRLLRQLLLESLVLALLGGALGLLLGLWGVRAIVAAHPGSLPRAVEIGVDARMLGFTAAVSLLTGALFGLAPALHGLGGSLTAALKEGGRAGSGAGRQVLRRGLVVLEVLLATMLVLACGLLLRSFWNLRQVDPGFDPEGVLSFQVSLPFSDYSEPARAGAFYEELTRRLTALPGVEAAAAMTGLPPDREAVAAPAVLEGVPEDPQGPPHRVDYWQFVTPGYFRAMRISLVDGRLFEPSDGPGAPGVVVVNRTMARTFWPGRSAVGRRLRAAGPEGPPLTIAGVVEDVKQGGIAQRTGTEIYFLHSQALEAAGALPQTLYVVLRFQGDPGTLLAAARAEVRRLDPAVPVSDVRMLDEVVRASTGRSRLLTRLVLLFALAALALAAVGIYGVLASLVEQRTREIGVRMALGAQAQQILRMILSQGAWLVGTGLALGVAGALALRTVLAGVLFGVAATDPAVFGAVLLVLAAVAVLACWLPARRAMKVEPAEALRGE